MDNVDEQLDSYDEMDTPAQVAKMHNFKNKLSKQGRRADAESFSQIEQGCGSEDRNGRQEDAPADADQKQKKVYFCSAPAPDKSMACLTELQRQYLKEDLLRKMQQAKSILRNMGDFQSLTFSLKDYYMHM